MKKILFYLMAAGLMLAFSAGYVLADSDGFSKAQQKALKAVKEATKKYKDVKEALYDGYDQEGPCVAIPAAGGMGFHYVNFSLMEDQYVDPFKPEILLYAPGKHSDRKLVGVEYTLVALGYDSEPDDPDALDRTPIPFFGNEDGPPLPPGWVWYTFPPTIFGQEFDSDSGYPMPSHGSPLDPYHYDLHFWVHKKNPNGAFEPWNPKVSCE